MKKKEKQQIEEIAIKLYDELQFSLYKDYKIQCQIIEKHLLEAYETGKIKGYEEGYEAGKS